MYRFIFQDEVLLDELDISIDVLSYLKEKRNQLLVYSNSNLEILSKKMNDINLETYLDSLIPNVDIRILQDSFIRGCFFDNIRNSIEMINAEIGKDGRVDFTSAWCGLKIESQRVSKESTVVISNQMLMCEEARKNWFQSIYYDKNNVAICGRKVKTLSTLKNIY